MISNDTFGKGTVIGGKAIGEQSQILNLKNVKLSQDEQDFIKEYRKLEELEREKGIKFFQCIGDPPHTADFVYSI